jgi:hypothetical protein
MSALFAFEDLRPVRAVDEVWHVFCCVWQRRGDFSQYLPDAAAHFFQARLALVRRGVVLRPVNVALLTTPTRPEK